MLSCIVSAMRSEARRLSARASIGKNGAVGPTTPQAYRFRRSRMMWAATAAGRGWIRWVRIPLPGERREIVADDIKRAAEDKVPSEAP
jgi:hypothetical protein